MGCVWVNQWSRVCMYGLCLGESVVVCLCMSYVRVFIYMNMGKALSRRMKWCLMQRTVVSMEGGLSSRFSLTLNEVAYIPSLSSKRSCFLGYLVIPPTSV